MIVSELASTWKSLGMDARAVEDAMKRIEAGLEGANSARSNSGKDKDLSPEMLAARCGNVSVMFCFSVGFRHANVSFVCVYIYVCVGFIVCLMLYLFQ